MYETGGFFFFQDGVLALYFDIRHFIITLVDNQALPPTLIPLTNFLAFVF